MESIREYLITVTAAAFICGMVTKLVKGGAIAAAVKLICGVFLALAVVSPLVKIKVGKLEDYTIDIRLDGEQLASQGENSAREAMAAIISEQTAAYILDKAEELGVTLQVEVTVSTGDYPAPCGARLEGNVSPYVKAVLSECIQEDLGISTEEQLWVN